MTDTVRTAVITGWGEAPSVHDLPAPHEAPGRSLVRLVAAAVNPVDLAIGSGRFYMPLPEPPFTAGVEAVGHVVQSHSLAPGSLVWCLRPDAGCWAETFSAPDDALVPVASDVDPVTAAAMGVAGLAGWMPVVTRGGLAMGETVVVLGATGVAGQVALQAARARGAGRVVAVGRNAERLEGLRRFGVDDILAIDDGDDLAGRISAACPERVNLVIDMLWGEAVAACIPAMAVGGRIVQVGSASGQTAVLPGGPLRGGRLDIRGFSVFSEHATSVAIAHADLTRAAAEGAVGVPVREIAFDDVTEAWEEQRAGTAGVKLVLTA